MLTNLRRQISSPASLFAFEAAARLRSFRRAAYELNVTQPSISYQIRNLERHLETKLFRRNGRSIELTEDGEFLFRAVSSGLQTIQTSIALLHKRTHQNLVTLCVSAPFATFFLMPNLPKLREQHPEIDLSLKIVSRDLNPLVESADFGVLRGDGSWSEFDCWKLYDEVVFPLCSPTYVDPARLPLSVEDLLKLDFLHLNERFRQRMGWKEFFAAICGREIKVEEHLSFSDQQPLIEAAISGHGLALGWLGTNDDLIRRRALIKPTTLQVSTDDAFYLVSPKGAELPKSAETFKAWILEISAPIRRLKSA